MELKLSRIDINDANRLWKMQVEAFTDLYNKYQDTQTNPSCEPVEKVITRLKQPFTYFYFIKVDNTITGAIRIVDTKENDKAKRISPVFIMPQYRNKGLAQKAILEAERIHGDSNWELETILQEKGNCHLYEKVGYYLTGKTEIISDKMTLVYYKKD